MNRLKETCTCNKDEQEFDVSCPHHGKDALDQKLGYYCQSCGGSGFVYNVWSFRKNAKRTIGKCPFCRE